MTGPRRDAPRPNWDKVVALVFMGGCVGAAILDHNWMVGVAGILGGLNWYARALESL